MNNPFKELNKIKAHLPIIEELAGVKPGYVHATETLAIKKGDIIVRPTLGYNTGRLQPQYVRFDRTPKGIYMFKAHRQFNSHHSKVITSHTQHLIVGRPLLKGGLVCFCKVKRIPENWTHFVVVSVAEDGKSVTVVPRQGKLRSLYTYPAPLMGKVKILRKLPALGVNSDETAKGKKMRRSAARG